MRPILIFISITFGLAWSIWAVAWALGAFTSGVSSVPAQAAVVLGAFSPAIAAILVRGRITREGFADTRIRPLFRHALPEYLFGLVLPLPVAIVVIALAAVLGLSTVHTELDPMILIGGLIGALLLGVLSIGEEFGWRGYLQIRWFAEQPARAAVATGIVWGIFHYPVILIGLEGYENVAIGLVVFTAFTIAQSIIQGWLMLRSGSIWTSCLAHGAANALGGSMLAYYFYGSGHWLLTSYAGILALLPLGAVCVWIVRTQGFRAR